MLNLFKKKIIIEDINPINAALIPKTNIVNKISIDFIEELKNGTLAEKEYAKKLEQDSIKENLIKWTLERSQEIDLISILKKRTNDKKPMWAFVNPNDKIKSSDYSDHDGNGLVTKSGNYIISTAKDSRSYEQIATNITYKEAFLPNSFPVLPQKIRDLIKEYTKYSDIKSLGILYKPKEWEEIKTLDKVPDPALIMTLNKIENRYFCLAIWGDDKPEIQEFIV